MTVHIKIAEKGHCEAVQLVFNHRDIIAWLGGFTHLKNLQDHVGKGQISLWYAWDDVASEVVGATMVGGRPQAHYLKYGQVAVLPHRQRQGIGAAMYFAMTAQGILEGRRHFEDTIVGDNPFQFSALPKLGLDLAGVLTMKTASGKDIALFQLSLAADDGLVRWDQMRSRFVATGHKIELRTNHYTRDLWAKNLEIAHKYDDLKRFAGTLHLMRSELFSLPSISVVDDPTNPTDERRKLFQQTRLVE